jgi:hypothetical protein
MSWELLRDLTHETSGGLSIRKDLEERMELSRFRFLFVPGFHYRTDPSSSADFAGPRTYLRNCGFDTQLRHWLSPASFLSNLRKRRSMAKLVRVHARKPIGKVIPTR